MVCVCVWCAAQHQPEVTATSLKVKKLLKLFGQCHGIYDCSFLDDNAIHKLGMLRKMVASFHLWGSPLEPCDGVCVCVCVCVCVLIYLTDVCGFIHHTDEVVQRHNLREDGESRERRVP